MSRNRTDPLLALPLSVPRASLHLPTQIRGRRYYRDTSKTVCLGKMNMTWRKHPSATHTALNKTSEEKPLGIAVEQKTKKKKKRIWKMEREESCCASPPRDLQSCRRWGGSGGMDPPSPPSPCSEDIKVLTQQPPPNYRRSDQPKHACTHAIPTRLFWAELPIFGPIFVSVGFLGGCQDYRLFCN